MEIIKDICSVCESIHDVELLEVGGDHGVLFKAYRCPIENETFEVIKHPQTLREWAMMYLGCRNPECGNVWCRDCSDAWHRIMRPVEQAN